MDKQQLLTKIDKAWSGLQTSIDGLTAQQMTQPGVTGDWSVKDILGHVTAWEEEALKHLPDLLDGKRPPRYSVLYGGIDAFNALKTVENRARSLDEVQMRFDQTHARLLDYIGPRLTNRSPPKRAFAAASGWTATATTRSTPRPYASGGSSPVSSL